LAACCLVCTAAAAQAQLPAIHVNGSEPSVFEGNPGGPAVTLNFTVALSSVSTQDVTALFSTFAFGQSGEAVSGTNCASANSVNGSDFIGVVNRLVTIPANANPPSVTVPVTVCRDTQVEFHQNFASQTREDIGVILTNAVNALCNGAECLSAGHIFDDDGLPSASVNNATVREPFSGTGNTSAVFTVTLSHPHPGFEVRIGWATQNGTASALPFGCGLAGIGFAGFPDYLSGGGTLVFPPNDMSETLHVSVCADHAIEPTETYRVVLTSQLNVLVVPIAGTGSILDSTLQILGTFTLDPEDSVLQAEESLTYRFQWTLTTGVWRDLHSLELRFRQRGTGNVPLWIRWVESTNTFQLCEGRAHDSEDDNDDDDADRRWTDREPHSGNTRCGTPVVAGSAQVLRAPLASLDMAGTRAIGSGPTGASVVLELPVTFKRGAAHRTYDVEVAAESDAGFRDDFIPGGVLVVRR